MVAVLYTGVLALVAAAGWALRRWTRGFEDYHEREYQDPPIFDPRGPGPF